MCCRVSAVSGLSKESLLCSGEVFRLPVSMYHCIQQCFTVIAGCQNRVGRLGVCGNFSTSQAEHEQSLERIPKQEKGYRSFHTSLLCSEGRGVLVILVTSWREKRNLCLD